MILLGKGAQVEAQFALFGDSRIASNVPYASKYIWKHRIELLDDMCHIESHFGVFGDNVSFGAR